MQAVSDRRAVTSNGIGQALALLAVLGYSGVNVLLRFVAGDVDPFVGSFIRQLPLLLTSATALLILRPQVLRRTAPVFLGTRTIVLLMFSGTISMVLGNVMVFNSLNLGGLIVTSSGTQAGMAIGGTVLSLLVLREPPTRAQLIGLFVVVAGLVVFALPAFANGVDSSWGIGVILSIFSGVCFTVANMVARGVQRKPKTFISTLALTNLGGVTLLVVIVMVRFGADIPLILRELGDGKAWILLSAGLANIVALGSITLAVRFTTLTVVSTTQTLILVIGVIVGWLGFNETLDMASVVGVCIILIGVVVTQFPMRRNKQNILVTKSKTDKILERQ